jgi:hypothetical protein
VDSPTRPADRRRPPATDYAEKRESTGLVGLGGRGSHPPASPSKTSDPHGISEALLFQGYGLDPDDLEGERVKRAPR